MNPMLKPHYNTYLNLVNDNFPKSVIQDNSELKSFFQSIHNSFIMSDILTEFGFVSSNSNVYNLIIEYKFFYSRLLTTLPLNDLFLIQNLLRLIVEKQYRIIYGFNFYNCGEKRIRKETRIKMDNRLINVIDTNLHMILNKLYVELSEDIHHTNSSISDFYDIQKRLLTENNIAISIQQTLDDLEKIFSELIFINAINNDSDKLTTGAKTRIENHLNSQLSTHILQST
ncbi:hypothetical protein [Carnobacterium maltaromaticum]|uniref:hypothetical protein n=1 Tax=Carnobacterium maltaromaticum TaxID=2751 RepID=UPI0039AFD057